MKTAKLSVVIPFHRNRAFLRRTLESVREQTIGELEVIVVDDCSGEPGVAELVSSMRSDRFSYVHNARRLGMGANWNHCVELASAPYVTILHADDELEPEYAEKMLAAHARHPHATGIYCRTRIIDADSRPLFFFPDYVKRFLDGQSEDDFVLSGESGVAQLMVGCFIHCPTVCYRKSALPETVFDDKWLQVLDLEFYMRVLFAGGTLVGIPDIALRYRRHAQNQTAILTATLARFREEFALHRDVAEASRRRGWTNAARVARQAPMIRNHLMFLASVDVLKGRWDAARTKLSIVKREAPAQSLKWE